MPQPICLPKRLDFRPFYRKHPNFLNAHHHSINGNTKGIEIIPHAVIYMEKGSNTPRVKEDKPCCQKERNVIQLVFGQTPPLGETFKGGHADHGHNEDEDSLRPVIDVVEDQLRIEDKHEGNARSSDVVHKALNAGGNRVRLSYGRSSVSSQTDGGSVVSQDAEIEAEQVSGH